MLIINLAASILVIGEVVTHLYNVLYEEILDKFSKKM